MDISKIPFKQLVSLTEKATVMTMLLRSEHILTYSAFVWDWLLTLETERDLLFSPGRWLVKLSYIFCRYWPLFMHTITLWVQLAVSDHRLCNIIFRAPLYLTCFNFASAASVLLVRFYAFSGARVLPTVVLGVGMLGVISFQVSIVSTKLLLAPFAPACFPMNADPNTRWLAGYFLAPLVWDTIISLAFILAAVKQRVRIISATGALKVFMDEGLVYYFAIAAVHALNTILSYQSDVAISGSLVPFSMLAPNLLACRLVINLRKVSAGPSSQDSESEPRILIVRQRRDAEFAIDLTAVTLEDNLDEKDERPPAGAGWWDASLSVIGTDSQQTNTTGATGSYLLVPPGFEVYFSDGRWRPFDGGIASGPGSDVSMIRSMTTASDGLRTMSEESSFGWAYGDRSQNASGESSFGGTYGKRSFVTASQSESSFTGTAGVRSNNAPTGSSFTGTGGVRSLVSVLPQQTKTQYRSFAPPSAMRPGRWSRSTGSRRLGLPNTPAPASRTSYGPPPARAQRDSFSTQGRGHLTPIPQTSPAASFQSFAYAEPPPTPLRYRLPGEGAGGAVSQAASFGYSSTFSPRVAAYPFNGQGNLRS